MHYYLDVLKKYAVFSGRAGRAEFWYFVLCNFLIGIVFSILTNIVGGAVRGGAGIITTLYSLYSLAVLVPSLAVSVRRLHDIGKSGWMILIPLIPLVGFIWYFVLMVLASQPGDNKYGPNPKGTAAR